MDDASYGRLDGNGDFGDCNCRRHRLLFIRRFAAHANHDALALFELLTDVVGDLHHLTAIGEAESHPLAFFPRIAQAEAEAVPVTLDAHDLQREQVALTHDLLRVGDAAIDQLRYVDQTFDRTFDAR